MGHIPSCGSDGAGCIDVVGVLLFVSQSPKGMACFLLPSSGEFEYDRLLPSAQESDPNFSKFINQLRMLNVLFFICSSSSYSSSSASAAFDWPWSDLLPDGCRDSGCQAGGCLRSPRAWLPGPSHRSGQTFLPLVVKERASRLGARALACVL